MVAVSDATRLLRARALTLGFDLVGVASAAPFDAERELVLTSLSQGHLAGMSWITPARVRLACAPDELLPGARSLLVLGTSYGAERPGASQEPSQTPVGRVARYAWGQDYHDVIPPRLRALVATVAEVAGPDVRCRWFVDTGPFLDRAGAARGGIGFIGKNTCVLTGPHGSYVFLSAILTTADLEPDEVAPKDCGQCRACLDACPTQAFVGPRQLDATRCISYLTIEHRGPIPVSLRPGLGDWVFGCDVCQEVCPWNRARPVGVHAEFGPAAGAGPTLDLQEVLLLNDVEFRARFRGTALTRTKRRGLARNAAIALGNRGDPAAIPALVQALGDSEPLIRGHAAWALGRLGPLPASALAALGAALAGEVDEEAASELRAVINSAAAPAATPETEEPLGDALMPVDVRWV